MFIQNNRGIVEEIDYSDPLTVFNVFALQPWNIFLDSADHTKKINYNNKYSFICVDPFIKILSKNCDIVLYDYTGIRKFKGDPFTVLKETLKDVYNEHVGSKKTLPFMGGAAGCLSYDLCHHIELLPRPKIDDMNFPDMAVGIYDLVIGYDHLEKRAFIFSSGLPLLNYSQRMQKAEERINWLKGMLCHKPQLPKIPEDTILESEIYTDFTKSSYIDAVQKVIDYIRAGDIFEANLTQRFIAKLPRNMSAFDLYRRLRLINPAPFSAYMELDSGVVIASASPERFILADYDRNLETRPIKGTRRRGYTDEEDKALADELINSKKDWAENIMIVDLLRNDFSKVCEDHTVRVQQLCGLETYETVHHLVSVITGKLKNQYDVIDLLRASFPGGSITGAPKVRAMEIISELEPNHRGPYCGSIGYIDFDGSMDTSIAIRTYAIKNEVVTFQAGGAVVLDSDPESEYEETLHKAYAFRKALTSNNK